MKNAKNFDCVALKDRIHEKLRRDLAGLEEAEVERRRAEWLETSDDPLAQWWRRQISRSATRSIESPLR